MKKHISEVELCPNKNPIDKQGCNHCEFEGYPTYHKDDFCLLCGYEMEGDRLYLEIHGSDGALNRVKDIDSEQPYVCMECAGQFKVDYVNRSKRLKDTIHLTDFIKEVKK